MFDDAGQRRRDFEAAALLVGRGGACHVIKPPHEWNGRTALTAAVLHPSVIFCWVVVVTDVFRFAGLLKHAVIALTLLVTFIWCSAIDLCLCVIFFLFV